LFIFYTAARKGQYKDAPPFPFVPGYECSGIVEQLGKDVEGFSVGERVVCFCDFGAYAEYVCVRAEGCVQLPDTVSFEIGAAFPVQYCTALHCLYETGSIRETSRVLIHACAGGVGNAALQFCNNSKCITIGTCGSDAKVELIKEKGVTHAINYNASNYEEEVMKLFPDGVDVILNSLGGATIKKDLALLRAGGRVVCFGGAAFNDPDKGKIMGALFAIPKVVSMLTLSTLNLLFESKTVCGVNMKIIGDKRPDLLSYELKKVMEMIVDGTVEPYVTETLPWDKIGEIQQKMENRKTTGKIVLVIPEKNEENEPAPDPEVSDAVEAPEEV